MRAAGLIHRVHARLGAQLRQLDQQPRVRAQRRIGTPGWAQSGERLVSAVRGISFHPPVVSAMADELRRLNGFRNMLIHGVWLWRDDHVMVMKRSLGKGERHIDYGTLPYAVIEQLVEDYQRLGRLADKLVTHLVANGGHEWQERYVCPHDGTRLSGKVDGETILQVCEQCGYVTSAEPLLS